MKKILVAAALVLVSFSARAGHQEWTNFVNTVNAVNTVVVAADCVQRRVACPQTYAPVYVQPPAYVVAQPVYGYEYPRRYYRQNYVVCRWVPDYDYYGRLVGHVKVCR